MPKYAEVLLPLAVQNTYTYLVPEDMVLSAGCRVLVPFGMKKIYTAIVVMCHGIQPQGYKVKEIIAKLDSSPVLLYPQLNLWKWIADYYMCTQGEVYKAAVPSGLKVESETTISVSRDFEEPHAGFLNDRERMVLDYASQRDRMRLDELAKITGVKHVEGVVSRLLDKGAVHVTERVVDNYHPRSVPCVILAAERGNNETLHALFDKAGRSKKHEQLLLAYLDLSQWMQSGKPLQEVLRDDLLTRADCSTAALNQAVKKGMFTIYRREVNRFSGTTRATVPPPQLTEEQDNALKQIYLEFKEHDVCLLHGVTSSGKTSIYMHMIADALERGKQVLYLVPEIALTTQLTQRLEVVFGERMLIYHSMFSDDERVDIWKRLLNEKGAMLVIGVRSSVFLPFSNLGLVIVDEEHDTSYKQQDPAPRYNGRDIAIVLAGMHGAKTLLGSATPAIETYYKASVAKRFGLVTLTRRYENIEMPKVEVINTTDARKKREMSGLISDALASRCRTALDAGEQVILFQNRRGYSPMVRCKQCAWVPTCENCDVSLTYHKTTRALSCHYCGHTITLPTVCPACGSPAIEIVGYGTERIEDNVESSFNGYAVARMDLDTTRSKSSYERIIDDFAKRKTKILVGTQMVTKGLDFDGVSVVGILNADTMLQFPDFRSHERAFNMMEQVAGRAGRAHKQGSVVIQSSDPSNPIIDFVLSHDYGGYFKHELSEREAFGFPPFTRLINIHLKHKDEATLVEVTSRYVGLIHAVFAHRMLGPTAPPVARVQNFYIRQITLKLEPRASMTKVKKILRDIYEHLLSVDSRAKSVRLYYDVDPV